MYITISHVGIENLFTETKNVEKLTQNREENYTDVLIKTKIPILRMNTDQQSIENVTLIKNREEKDVENVMLFNNIEEKDSDFEQNEGRIIEKKWFNSTPCTTENGPESHTDDQELYKIRGGRAISTQTKIRINDTY